MSRFPLFIVLLVVVVIVSGCTGFGGSTGSGGGAGVIIEAFEPDFPEVFTGEQAELRLKVKNVGGVDASDVMVGIVGINSDFLDDTKDALFGQLIAADNVRGTSGESGTATFSFHVEPETVPVGLTITYTPIARLAYTYHTTTVKSITFLSSQEMRSLQDSGRPLPAETVSTTSGPIGIDISTKGPIRFFENVVTFPLEVTVTNRGGGVVCNDKADQCSAPESWNRLSLTLAQSDNVEMIDCKLDDVPLFRGQSNTFTCKVTVSELPQVGSTQKLFQVTANYGYFVEKATSVKVTGRAD